MAYAETVSSVTALIRSWTGRLCQYRYSSAFISSRLSYTRTVLSIPVCSIRPGAFQDYSCDGVPRRARLLVRGFQIHRQFNIARTPWPRNLPITTYQSQIPSAPAPKSPPAPRAALSSLQSRWQSWRRRSSAAECACGCVPPRQRQRLVRYSCQG